MSLTAVCFSGYAVMLLTLPSFEEIALVLLSLVRAWVPIAWEKPGQQGRKTRLPLL